MESEAASRRIHRIASHLLANVSLGGGILHPMGCSGTSNSVIRRYDNMILFARQGTSSQGYFMRQFTIKQFPDDDVRATSCLNAPFECTSMFSSACDKKNFTSNANRDPIFGSPAEFQHGSASSLENSQKQLQHIHSAAARTPQFSKPASDCNSGEEKSAAAWEPQFSKPASCYDRGVEKSAAAQAPQFVKMTSGCNIVGQTTLEEGLSSGQIFNNNSLCGLEWSPRMDVAESGNAYVVTIELPGVTASDIRVEVDDKRLITSGKRSMACWMEGNNKSTVYHKRELAEGPYRVVWPLPADSNRDAVSAEFLDGLLQIRIPKGISDMN